MLNLYSKLNLAYKFQSDVFALNHTSTITLFILYAWPYIHFPFTVNIIATQGKITFNVTVNVELDKTAVLPCHYDFKLDYPAWRIQSKSGNATDYQVLSPSGDPAFNEALNISKRMSWATNNTDIVLAHVTRDDEGTYICDAQVNDAALVTWLVQLNVRGLHN